MNLWIFVLSWFACAIRAQDLPNANINHRHPDVAYCTDEPCYRWDNYFYETVNYTTFKVVPITAQAPQGVFPLIFVNVNQHHDDASHTSDHEVGSAESGAISTKNKHQKSPIDTQTISEADAVIDERFSDNGTITCCNITLTSRADVQKHFFDCHNPDLQEACCPYIDCTYASTKSHSRLSDHYIQKHFIPSIFCCPFSGCFTNLGSRAALLVHLRKHKSKSK